MSAHCPSPRRHDGALGFGRTHCERASIAMAQELAGPDDAPITPGSRRRRPRRIAAAAEDSDGEGAVTPAADEIAAELTRLATTCSSDGTPTGPRHGGADDASRPWHGGRGLARAEAEAEAEPDPTQIHVHELKIAPQPQHVSSCLRAGHRGRGQRQTGDALPGPLTRQSQPRRPQARPALRCRAQAYPKPVLSRSPRPRPRPNHHQLLGRVQVQARMARLRGA